MGLNDSQFTTDLTNAFGQTDWAQCATIMSKAIQDYVTSGEVSTKVNGTHMFPTSPGGSEPIINLNGKQGKVISLTSSGLTQKIMDAFKEQKFEDAAKQIATVTDIFVKSCTVFVNVYDPPYKGTGVAQVPTSTGPAPLPPIVPTGYSILETAIILAFAIPMAPWSAFINAFSIGLKIYMTTCIVNTLDLGALPVSAPPLTWFGLGIGSIS